MGVSHRPQIAIAKAVFAFYFSFVEMIRGAIQRVSSIKLVTSSDTDTNPGLLVFASFPPSSNQHQLIVSGFAIL